MGWLMFRKSLALAGALGLIAGGAQATPEAATYTLQISGIVPTVCNANLDSSTVASEAGEVALGQLKEFCNDSAGYQVWVDYSPNLAGDTLTVGGQQIVLDNSGSALIDSANGPNIASKTVLLDVPQNGVSGTVSLRVVTL
jgi:hypothetical protein